jgi:hypothetical protein
VDAHRKTDMSRAACAGTERPAVLLRAAYSNREIAASALPHPGCFEGIFFPYGSSGDVEEKATHTLSNQGLPFPPRFMNDLLDWREEIFKDTAGAEVDLGVDLHAGDEAKDNTGQPALSATEVSVQSGPAQPDPCVCDPCVCAMTPVTNVTNIARRTQKQEVSPTRYTGIGLDGTSAQVNPEEVLATL